MFGIVFRFIKWYVKWFGILFIGNTLVSPYAFKLYEQYQIDGINKTAIGIKLILLYSIIIILEIIWVVFLFRKKIYKKRKDRECKQKSQEETNTMPLLVDEVTYYYYQFKNKPEIKEAVIQLRNQPENQGKSDEEILREMIRKTLYSKEIKES